MPVSYTHLFILLALFPVPTFTMPLVPESSVTDPVDPEVKERLVPLPVVILPAPTKPKAVALVLMVSREEAPVRAPPVDVYKRQVEGVVAPMAVPLIPVEVVLKFPEVMVRLLLPREIEEALKPERLRVPLVAVRFRAPDERVKPLEAVNNLSLIHI